MARRKFTEVERNIMKEVAANLRELLKANNWTQKMLSDKVGLSASVISDYMNEKTLPTPGSVQLLSEAFGVAKGRIDPSFASDPGSASPTEVKLRFVDDLERELNLDLTDPVVQRMIKKATKVMFTDED